MTRSVIPAQGIAAPFTAMARPAMNSPVYTATPRNMGLKSRLQPAQFYRPGNSSPAGHQIQVAWQLHRYIYQQIIHHRSSRLSQILQNTLGKRCGKFQSMLQ